MKLFSVFLFFFASFGAHSQTQYKAVPDSDSSILIEGTSNIHDWEIAVNDFTSQLDLSLKGDKPDQVNSVKLSIPVISFDSGKGRMDKNTYEALNESKHKLVSFTSSTPTQLLEKGSGVYGAILKGELTISGVTQSVEIPVQLQKVKDGYTLKSEHELKMTDFKIQPPKALFGTITTGDAVNIIFNLTHYKS